MVVKLFVADLPACTRPDKYCYERLFDSRKVRLIEAPGHKRLQISIIISISKQVFIQSINKFLSGCSPVPSVADLYLLFESFAASIGSK